MPSDGVAMASGRLEHVAWTAADPDVLYRVGQAMNLPGGAQPLDKAADGPCFVYLFLA